MERHYDRVRVESVVEIGPDTVRVEFSGTDPRAILPGYRNYIDVPGAYLHGSWPIQVGDLLDVADFARPESAQRAGIFIWIKAAGISGKVPERS